MKLIGYVSPGVGYKWAQLIVCPYPSCPLPGIKSERNFCELHRFRLTDTTKDALRDIQREAKERAVALLRGATRRGRAGAARRAGRAG